jgi:hypothetical protein
LNSRVLTKDVRVLYVAEAYGSQTRPFEVKSHFALAQLRDVLAAKHSAVVPQKRNHARHARPQRA